MMFFMSTNGLINEKVVGTNCDNCKFIANNSEEIDPKILDAEGGIDPKNEKETDRAEQADLIIFQEGPKLKVRTRDFVITRK
jgi:hypothetical protein